MDILDRLTGHDAWTTRQLLLRCRELDDAALHRRLDAGHESVHATLVHMIGNVRTWTDLMRGDPIAPAGADRGALTVDELIARHDAASADFRALARRIQGDGRLDERWIDTLDDPPTAKTYGGAIVHVVTHNMHHRAELLHMLHRLGLKDLPEGDALSWEAATAPDGYARPDVAIRRQPPS